MSRTKTSSEPASFQVGDFVSWTSQAAGYARAKYGQVLEVVPAGAEPSRDRWPQLHRRGIGMPRTHVSYVVKVTGRGIYWPNTSGLKAAAIDDVHVHQNELLAPEKSHE